MTSYTFSPNQGLAITQNFEGLGSTPFYILNGDWNFGYGYDMTKNNSSSQASYWGTALLNNGVPQSIVTSVQNDMAAGNISAANSAISALTSAQISSAEYGSSSYFYQNIAIPAVTSTLSSSSIQFSALPIGTQAALTDLYYNAGTGYIGNGLKAALSGGLSTGDYSSVAYQLAFNTAPPGATSAYAYRATADALTALGLTYTINGPQNITAVSGTSSPSQIIEFLSRVKQQVTPPISSRARRARPCWAP